MTRKMLFLFFTMTVTVIGIQAQGYEDYIGAGHMEGVKVYSSSDLHERYPGKFVAKAENTINGQGLDAPLMEASRFLSQSTLGYDMKIIHEVAETGISTWLDQQFEKPAPDFIAMTRETFDLTNLFELNVAGKDSSEISERPRWTHFEYTWWQYNAFNDEDMVRQRVAEALSEIFVVSYQNARLAGRGMALASYYNILLKNAFGNYLDLLRDITYSPTMGNYLSHFNNPKTDTSENQHPDENYAREIMQLFSIGLYELNPDGSRKKDADGNFIPTYDNGDISEFAKIFTGLGASDVIENMYRDTASFGMYWGFTDFTQPMKMYEEWHEPGEKHLLRGVIVPDGQTGEEDIEMALQTLFNHPNVGPFIGKRLIQRLVKSNPTPQYVEDITQVFNDNGQGVRGDLKAVIRAILMHPEARDCQWLTDPTAGKMREPLMRYTHFARSMTKDQPYGNYWNIGYNYNEEVGQNMFGSPTVFNFYNAQFTPNGPLADLGLVGPEFEIHNTRSSVAYANYIYGWVHWNYIFYSWVEDDPDAKLEYYELYPLARQSEPFINYMDVLYSYGNLTKESRSLLRWLLERRKDNNEYKEDRVRLGLYFMLLSPDFVIQK